MNSLDNEFKEIREFDKSIFGKDNSEIENILAAKNAMLITQLHDKKPISVCIKFNGYLKVVNYEQFEKDFPNLYNYRETKKFS